MFNAGGPQNTTKYAVSHHFPQKSLICLCLPLVGVDHGGVPQPVGPTPRPDVHPLPPGTHLLFAQSGRIEHVPLEGYSMKKDDAKTVLHLPVSLFK